MGQLCEVKIARGLVETSGSPIINVKPKPQVFSE